MERGRVPEKGTHTHTCDSIYQGKATEIAYAHTDRERKRETIKVYVGCSTQYGNDKNQVSNIQLEWILLWLVCQQSNSIDI